VVQATVRHQRAGRADRAFRNPDAQHAHPDRSIRSNEKDGLAPFDAVVEATVQRSRPVILTALAAMLAFIPLTHSVFWGTLAYTLIGGTFGGTVLTLVFLPALYAIWFKIKPVAKGYVSERFLSKRKRAAVPAPALAPIQGGSGDAPSGEGERL